MLVTQFDKFVNRSTQEILGDEIVQENLEPMLSTDIARSAGGVTGVKGENEIYYRTGNVNLTSADIGALDDDNVYNGLDKTEAGYALDARQGKVLNEAIDDKLDKDNVYNGLDKTEAGYALDARQGKTLNEAIVDKLDKANVYNGLDQTNQGYALDARQGKTLNDKIAKFTCGTKSDISVSSPHGGQYYTDVTVAHGLGVVPDAVIVTPLLSDHVPSNYISSISVTSKDSTNFTVRVWSMARRTIDLCWMARAN